MNVPIQVREWFNGLPENLKRLSKWETLSKDQWIAVWRICRTDASKCISLTGRAGSGKSFVVKFCHKLLSALRKEVIILGSTGVARQNVGGEATIHKFGFLGIGDFLPLEIREKAESGVRTRKSIISSGTKLKERFNKGKGEVIIVIDEKSMASSELLILFYQAIKIGLEGREFRFVGVGDFRQLEPVPNRSETCPWTEHSHLAFEDAVFTIGKDEEQEDYIYSSLFSQRGPFLKNQMPKEEWSYESLSLLKNHRQKEEDRVFIEALNALGDGIGFNDPRVYPLLSRVFVQKGSDYIQFGKKNSLRTEEIENSLRVCFTNKEVKAYNNQKLEEFRGKGAARQVYKANVVGLSWTEGQILKDLEPVEQECELFSGMKFMVRCNIDEFLANGTVGTIIQMDKDSIKLRLEDGYQTVLKKTRFSLPKNSDGSSVGTFETVAAGHLAYASTAWKVQGLTVTQLDRSELDIYRGEDKLVLVIDKCWKQHGLLYTVCSRVQSLDQLVILCKKLSDLEKMIIVNPRIKEFIDNAEQNMRRWTYEIDFLRSVEIHKPHTEGGESVSFKEKINIYLYDSHQYCILQEEVRRWDPDKRWWIIVADPVLKRELLNIESS